MTNQWRSAFAGMLAALVCVVCGAVPVAAQISDTQPPHLVSISFSPASVDVTTNGASVVVAGQATDDLSGINGISVTFVSVTAPNQRRNGFLSRISGTPLNGAFQGTVNFPTLSAGGVWRLSVTINDAAGNFLSLSPANLTALGFQTDLTVVSTADTAAPVLAGVSITPAAIDVSNGDQLVTIALSVTDNASGADFQNFFNFSISFSSPSGQQTQRIAAQEFTLVSGTATNGVWNATHRFPRYSEAGNWLLSDVRLTDRVGNVMSYSPFTQPLLGFPHSLAVASSLSDSARAELVGMTFSPSVIDTSAGSQTVTVTFHMLDNLSGVTFDTDTPLFSFLRGIRFTSPSGQQTRSNNTFGGVTLASGTSLNGVWQTRVVFQQFSEAGTWRATVFSLRDVTNNTFSLFPADLIARGLPSELTIFRPSLVSDGSSGPAGGTVSDSTFGSSAQVTFPAGALPSSTTVSIDVLTNPPPIPTPTGFQPGTLFTSITLSPVPPMPFPAPGLTLVLPLGQFKAPGSRMRLFRLDPATGALVPAYRVSGGQVSGVVDATGLSATFTGVSHLSTVVGFLETTLLGDVDGDGEVTCADLGAVKAAFGRRTGQLGYSSNADVNGDGVINVIDLSIVTKQLPAGTRCQ
jgi:hypothetical protein